EPLVKEVIRDPHVHRRGLVRLPGARVKVAERVERVPVARLLLDHAGVFRDGAIEPALTEQLLRFFQRVFAVESQGSTKFYQRAWEGGMCGDGPRSSRNA